MESKATLVRLASMVLNTPLMILPNKLSVIMSVIGPRVGLVVSEEVEDLFAQEFGLSDNRGTVPEGTKGISVVPVLGSLAHRSHGLSPKSGLTTYDDIRNDFSAALESESSAILLDVDSYGGDAAAVMDLSDDIYNARGEKPIYAIANESAYSAAYAIASAADKIFLSRSAGVGSVGVIAQFIEQTKFDEDMGLKYETLFRGERKNDFNPHAPITNEAKAMLDQDLDELFDLIAETVARNRDMKVAQVKATKAGIYMGKNAVDVGFADEVMSFEAAVQRIANPSGRTIVSPPQEKSLNEYLETFDIGRRNTIHTRKEEVKEMDFEQFKKEHPGLLADITAKITDEVTLKLTAKHDAEKEELEASFGQERESFTKRLEDQEKRLDAQEKNEAIRTERELKSTAENIWTRKLAKSSIPDRYHDKAMNQVKFGEFVDDDSNFDLEAFSKAVDAEIEDWESKSAGSEVLGLGASVKDVTAEDKAQEEEDQAIADRIFSRARGIRKEVK